MAAQGYAFASSAASAAVSLVTSGANQLAVVVDGIPLDALAARLSLQRNAIYKVIFDARRKIRRALVANGYLEDGGLERR